MTQQRGENAAKWLHTRNVNEIEPFRRLLFVKLTIGGLMMASRSELRDRTYFLRSHACESHTTFKMRALPLLER